MTKFVLVLVSLFTFTFSVNAQEHLSTSDSIKQFYQSFFDLLKKNSVFKDSVNWDAVEDQTNKRLLTYKTMASAINEVSSVLLKIGDFHSKLFYNGSIIQAKQINFPKDLFSLSWLDKFETKPSFEVKVLDNNYGYVLMPAINNPGNLDFDKVTQDMYDKIWTIKKKYPLKGWIIDLRFNTGGTCVPMLLSLYDFLEKGTIWNTIDDHGVLIENIKFQKGKYISNGHSLSKIKVRGSALEKVKVAILTSVVTASSGEIVCIAFKCRPNTIFIGETTAGFTTVNTTFKLPFDSVIAISMSHASDCKSNRYSFISPDYYVKKKDNFENLLSDEHIQIALQYFSKMQ
jgi:hypothetical protein